jgi:hypothetical protein
MARNRLEIILSGQVRDFNAKLKEAQNQADESFGAIEGAAQSAGAALAGMAVSGALLTKSFVDKAVEMQQYRGTLIAVMKDTEAADMALRKMIDFAAKTPFDVAGVVAAGVKLRTFQADIDRFLPLAGELAAVFKRDIRDAADAVGKSFSGSQDGLTQLADSFGIAKAELIKFGAVKKADGSIKTEGDVDALNKLRDALEKVIKTKYGGAMEQQAKTAAGAFSNLSDAVDQLKAAMGAELTDEFATVAKYLTTLVQDLGALPDTTKQMIAYAVVAATAFAGLGVALAGIALVIGPLTTAWKGFQAINALTTITVTGLTASISASTQAAITGSAGMATLTGGVASAGAASAATTISIRAMSMALLATPIGIFSILAVAATGAVVVMGQLNKKAEETRVSQQKMADEFRNSKTAIAEAATALREYQGDLEKATEATVERFKKAGKTDLDAAKAIDALRDQRDKAQLDGDKARANTLIERIKVLSGVRERLAGTQAEKDKGAQKAAEDAKKAEESRAKSLEEYEKKSTAGVYATKAIQLAALDEILKKTGIFHADFEKLSLSRVKLAREVAAEEVKAAEESRKKSVDAALHELDVLKALDDDNLRARKAKLEELLSLTIFNADERKKLELEVLETKRQIAEQDAETAKKAAEEKLKAEETAAKIRVANAQSDKAVADQELEILNERLSRGEDVTEQIKDQIEARQKLNEELIREAAAQDKIGKSAAEKASIDKQAADAIKMSQKDSARESEALDREVNERKKQETLEALKLQDQLAKAKLEADKDVTQGDLTKTAKERLLLAEEQLRVEADLAAMKATPEAKIRIQSQLELDIFNLRKSSTEELAKASEELEKAKKRAEDLKGATLGGIMGLDEFVKSTNDAFAKQRNSGEPAEDEGLTEAERNKAANQLGVNPNATVPGSTGPSSGDWGVSRRDREEAEAKAAAEAERAKAGDSESSAPQPVQLAVQVNITAPNGQKNNDWRAAWKTSRVGE